MILDFKLKETDVIEDMQLEEYIFDKDSSLKNNEILDLKLKVIKKFIELSERLDTEDAIRIHCNEMDILSMILVISFHSLKEKYFNLIVSYHEDTDKIHEMFVN